MGLAGTPTHRLSKRREGAARNRHCWWRHAASHRPRAARHGPCRGGRAEHAGAAARGRSGDTRAVTPPGPARRNPRCSDGGLSRPCLGVGAGTPARHQHRRRCCHLRYRLGDHLCTGLRSAARP
ncbi:hypothetical protein EAH89_28460 [Roseomonas nepalensis]|uniref:Uncharacterized protein n=1 Tax=Muricoccus nepalensis TaxID=1854500 RepID=A0A502EXY9_9PROT|nr:hypothetical protein EAH89_28460 [Roseomonas nepalensis]